MKFAGDDDTDDGRGRRSIFTREQHLQALEWFRAQNGRWGAKSELAHRFGIDPSSMRTLLKRAARVEGEAHRARNVPLGTCPLTDQSNHLQEVSP